MPKGKRVECFGGSGIAGSWASRGLAGGSAEFDPRLLSSASTLVAWWRASQLMTLDTTLGGDGSTPPTLTWSGAGPVEGLRVEIDSVAGGTLRGQATFRYSLQSGASGSWVSGVLTAATVALSGADIVLAFPTGVYATDHVWQPVPSSWTDAIGGHVLSQATALSRPRHNVNLFGSRPGLWFDNADDRLRCADSLANAVVGGEDAAFTVICVARVRSLSAAEVIWCFDNSADTGFCDLFTTATDLQCNKKGDSDSVHSASGGAADTDAHVYSLVHSGTTATGYIDGVSQFSTAQNATSLTVDGFSVGATFINSVASNRLGGDIGEIIIHSAALSGGDRAESETRLLAHYGI
jgi:hypothetical protein